MSDLASLEKRLDRLEAHGMGLVELPGVKAAAAPADPGAGAAAKEIEQLRSQVAKQQYRIVHLLRNLESVTAERDSLRKA